MATRTFAGAVPRSVLTTAGASLGAGVALGAHAVSSSATANIAANRPMFSTSLLGYDSYDDQCASCLNRSSRGAVSAPAPTSDDAQRAGSPRPYKVDNEPPTAALAPLYRHSHAEFIRTFVSEMHSRRV